MTETFSAKEQSKSLPELFESKETTMKNIIEQSDNEKNTWEVYTDHSAKVRCIDCRKQEELDKERVAKITGGDFNKLSSYLCFDCWKKGRSGAFKGQEPANGIQERIMRGQAYNLANAAMLAEGENPMKEGFFPKLRIYFNLYLEDLNK